LLINKEGNGVEGGRLLVTRLVKLPEPVMT